MDKKSDLTFRSLSGEEEISPQRARAYTMNMEEIPQGKWER